MRIYAAIDLKSFYASCECVERRLNPMTTNLVVADKDRTEKTICLAVSPSLKSYGIKGRARLYEVVSIVNKVNEKRSLAIKGKFINESYNNEEIRLNPYLKLSYIVAKPRMSLYMKYSSKIYSIYLKYVSKEDIYPYSIDEVFIDITNYLKYNKLTPEEMVTKMVQDVYKSTGITATAGIGTNLYLAKVSMDILAKHIKPNKDNVRIAMLDELSYRKLLWDHVPLTDFWRVGRGYSEKLIENKMYTMGDVARCSIDNEDLLFQLFGINAEILIDHAWGYEPCTMKDIKKFKPKANSISIGQVLKRPYTFEEAKIIVIEMTDLLCLQLVEKGLITNKISLTINYDSENINSNYDGKIKKDYYGRFVPKESHKIVNLSHYTSSSTLITNEITLLYKRIVDPFLTIRRITIAFLDVLDENNKIKEYKQFSLFTDSSLEDVNNVFQKKSEDKDKEIGKTIINIKKKYGKNAILKGINLLPESTMIERNEQIGGHHE